MRLGVLDVGSNTVHLLVVDASSRRASDADEFDQGRLRLAESIDDDGKLTRKGAEKLIATVDEFAKIARSSGLRRA